MSSSSKSSSSSKVEVWLDVVGYEGLYEVSDMGRVRRCDSKYVLSTRMHNNMERVNLFKDGNRITFYIHRLVLMAHCPIDNPQDYEVNHILPRAEGGDNTLINLEWVTREENARKLKEIDDNRLQGNKVNGRKSPRVAQYTKDGAFIQEHDTVFDAARSVGKDTTDSIRKCCIGKTKSSCGYVWKYI